ncbi:hypothetical protein [Microvirga massiliensis]|uniref:hypothetical protein n=1 Tax=Microvirga massiliensis TaxID=1033741 RepID=UPI00062B7AAC|nr:hypothetical protein [Microvirga massiliensis]
MKRACLMALLVTSPITALADQKSADACAAKLSKEPAAIYSSTVAQISPGVSIKDVVVNVTRSMVMAGRLSRANARPAAEAAGNCLELIRK